MIYIPQQWVKVAVDRLGGPTKTATAMAVSNTTIHNWIKRQRVSNVNKARQLAKLTGLQLQQMRPTL